MIYTSYFVKIRELEKNGIVPISICLKSPNWYKGLKYRKLAPKYGFFAEWRENRDNDYYVEHFQSEVLDQLNVCDVVYELSELVKSDDVDIALICYEKPADFCHRHLVAEWLVQNGFRCEEWKNERN